MKYKIIVLDLDGTLTNSKKNITKKTKDLLLKIQEQGSIVVLASGRPTYGIIPLAKELQLEKFGGYILSFNGAMIINCKTKETIFSTTIPTTSNKTIIELANQHNLNISTYEHDEIITKDGSCQFVQTESKITKMSVRSIPHMKEYVTFPVVKYLMMAKGEILEKQEPIIKEALGENFSVYRSEPFFLEILPKGIDKAKSLERLLSLLDLSPIEMIACGDGYNDLTMIQYAGLGVAMENAVTPVKDAANYITYSNDEDGVAHIIEKFMLF